MDTIAAVKLRCPDCGKAAGPLGRATTCPGCGRAFAPDEGVWDLRPRSLDARKDHEDRVHAETGLPTWRRLFFHKRYWLEWCETRWLPELLAARPASFLEIGGGLCYASALAKGRVPAARVVATDISPRYLRQHALRTGAILGTPADVYAAADAEALPFEDGEFQAVFSQVVLYRLPDPARALREIRRVLAPGGRYLGIERASPWAPWFARREARVLDERARAQGTGERPRRYRDWEALLAEAGWESGAVTPVPGRRVRARWLRRLGNAARPIYVAIRLAR
ncbi:MAG TPA: class I SAM-dependent methyltransferase [Pseudomonadales bacterium]|nr:class I SAM-dependent methyltransferase [Pseudomonadales bacterium]